MFLHCRAVAIALARTAGRAVGPAAAGLAVAVALPSTILFSPQGMRARDVIAWMDGGLAARLSLWAGWVGLAAPVVRLAFEAPGTRALRSLPVREGKLVAGLLALGLAVQGPWALLFLRGAGPTEALAAALTACALQAALAAGVGKLRGAAVLAGAAALALARPPAWAWAPAAAALAWLGVWAAWRLAPERSQSALRLTRVTRPLGALLLAHGIHLLRVERVRLSRGAAVAAAGAGVHLLSLRNDPPTASLEAAQRRLLIEALPLVVVAAGLAGPVTRGEARLRWLTLSAGLGAGATRRAALLATSLATGGYGALSGALAALIGAALPLPLLAPAWWVVGEGAAWGALLGAVAHGWADREAQARRPDQARLSVQIALSAAAAMVAAAVDARAGLGLAAAAAAAALWSAGR